MTRYGIFFCVCAEKKYKLGFILAIIKTLTRLLSLVSFSKYNQLKNKFLSCCCCCLVGATAATTVTYCLFNPNRIKSSTIGGKKIQS